MKFANTRGKAEISMKSTFVFLAVFLLGFVCLGYADDGAFSEYPQSGTVFPLKNEYIQMISEEVIYKNGQFTTTFEFLNTSNKEQEVTIGFPIVGDFQFSGDTVDEEPKSETEKLQKIMLLCRVLKVVMSVI